MSKLLDEGRELLAREAAQQAAADQAAAEATAIAELRLSSGAILELLGTVVSRLALLEAQVERTESMVMATRVRRPVRDELGTILYVVDELQPPVWAQPMEDHDD